MGKYLTYDPLQPPVEKKPYRKLWGFILVAFAFCLYSQTKSSQSVLPIPLQHTLISSKGFDWYNLKPSESIKWVDCFDDQKCARFSLPLDYLTPEGPKTHIALRMIPATDKKNYKGPVLINPGGPGGSGTFLVERVGKNISKVIGPEFDILGFDPRGTGATTPVAQCMDSEMQFKQWDNLEQSLMFNTSDNSVAISRSRQNLMSERCLQAIGGNGREDLNGTAEEWGPGRFMTSASVATDMLRITKEMGHDKLQYWGFSYGSVLGQYFASMYPDNVGRLVIDGVYDAYGYRDGLWDDNLEDTDRVVSSFYKFCYEAGPDTCPFYESTPEQVEERVQKIFMQVKNSPVPVPYAKSGPALITYGIITRSLFAATYKPLQKFESFASDLRAVEINNQTALATAFEGLLSVKCDCSQDTLPWLAGNEAMPAIAFGDSGLLAEKEGDFEAHYARLASHSPFAAQIWAIERLKGWSWKIDSKWRFNGPFSANTSHPILVSQPTWDPVCPISHARRVQKRFTGAGFLEQQSYGHCTISSPSVCSAKHIRAYFLNGTLPPEGTVCHPDALPFIGAVNPKSLSVEDSELLDALMGLTDAVPRWGLGSL